LIAANATSALNAALCFLRVPFMSCSCTQRRFLGAGLHLSQLSQFGVHLILLIAKALVGIGGVEDLGRGIEGKKARGLCVVSAQAGRSQGPVSRIGGEYSDAVVAAVRGVDDATGRRDGDLGAVLSPL
jgi:hypothetical protein